MHPVALLVPPAKVYASPHGPGAAGSLRCAKQRRRNKGWRLCSACVDKISVSSRSDLETVTERYERDAC